MGCEGDSVATLDTTELDQKIVEATSFLEGKEEGTQPGFYSNKTITKLNNRIEWARYIICICRTKTIRQCGFDIRCWH